MELIDREKLINEIEKECKDTGDILDADDCIFVINDQPTVNTWISVEDRLPSERDWYLVKWKEKSTEFVGVPKIADFLGIETEHTTQNGWMFQEELPIEYLKDLEVIAYMPIPEYKE